MVAEVSTPLGDKATWTHCLWAFVLLCAPPSCPLPACSLRSFTSSKAFPDPLPSNRLCGHPPLHFASFPWPTAKLADLLCAYVTMWENSPHFCSPRYLQRPLLGMQ